jgi:hypothetical protein
MFSKRRREIKMSLDENLNKTSPTAKNHLMTCKKTKRA